MARKPDAKRDRLGLRVHTLTREIVERTAQREKVSMSEAAELLIQHGFTTMPKGWRP